MAFTRITNLRIAAAFGLLTMFVTPAVAQGVFPSGPRAGSFVSVFAGGARATSSMGGAAGGTFGSEVTPRLAIEGRARWFDMSAGDSAYAADFGVRYTVMPTTASRPYVSAGAGLFRAAMTSESDAVPAFYRDRITHPGTRQVFRDMAWTVGGGADLFMSGHVALRPDVTLLVVSTRNDVRIVPLYGLHLAYFFQSHTSRTLLH